MVSLHTKTLCEIIVSASAEMMMASLRTHDAKVTFCKALKAGVAVTLRKAFVRCSSARLAVDAAQERQMDHLANQCIHRLHLVTEGKSVLNLMPRAHFHF